MKPTVGIHLLMGGMLFGLAMSIYSGAIFSTIILGGVFMFMFWILTDSAIYIPALMRRAFKNTIPRIEKDTDVDAAIHTYIQELDKLLRDYTYLNDHQINQVLLESNALVKDAIAAIKDKKG